MAGRVGQSGGQPKVDTSAEVEALHGQQGSGGAGEGVTQDGAPNAKRTARPKSLDMGSLGLAGALDAQLKGMEGMGARSHAGEKMPDMAKIQASLEKLFPGNLVEPSDEHVFTISNKDGAPLAFAQVDADQLALRSVDGNLEATAPITAKTDLGKTLADLVKKFNGTGAPAKTHAAGGGAGMPDAAAQQKALEKAFPLLVADPSSEGNWTISAQNGVLVAEAQISGNKIHMAGPDGTPQVSASFKGKDDFARVVADLAKKLDKASHAPAAPKAADPLEAAFAKLATAKPGTITPKDIEALGALAQKAVADAPDPAAKYEELNERLMTAAEGAGLSPKSSEAMSQASLQLWGKMQNVEQERAGAAGQKLADYLVKNAASLKPPLGEIDPKGMRAADAGDSWYLDVKLKNGKHAALGDKYSKALAEVLKSDAKMASVSIALPKDM